MSISGPPRDLNLLKERMNASATATADVHAWYHGGEELEMAVLDVARDVQRRSITFPSSAEVQKPVRSTLDGSILDPSTIDSTGFIPWVVRHLLVHCVDWSKTSQEICKTIEENLSKWPDVPIQIMSVGPSTAFLLSEIKATVSHPSLDLLDISPFKPNQSKTSQGSRSDDIAIVGMGINLPKSRSPEQLWETLSKGLSTVQEVGNFLIFEIEN
jgi:Beta-ketoacyl synthase, N-terminal domain